MQRKTASRMFTAGCLIFRTLDREISKVVMLAKLVPFFSGYFSSQKKDPIIGPRIIGATWIHLES